MDSQRDDSTLTTPRALHAQPSPHTRDSRRRVRRRELLTAGVILFAVSIAAAWLLFSRPAFLSPPQNTNQAALQTPTPAPQPSAPPTPEANVSPTPEASQQPVDNPANANRRAVPVATPTPHPVTPPPTPPRATPTPTPNIDEPPDEADEGAGPRDIDERIRLLQQRKAALLVNHSPDSPEVRAINRRLANLRRKRAQRRPPR